MDEGCYKFFSVFGTPATELQESRGSSALPSPTTKYAKEVEVHNKM